MAQLSIIEKRCLEGALRIDAEYYQPKYYKILDSLKKLNAISLATVSKVVKRKFNPIPNQYFNYIEISEVDLVTGASKPTEVLGKEAPSRAQFVVKRDDVIISNVRPIRNAVSLISDKENDFVCSSGFTVLRPEEVSPEYLFAYLKTKPIIQLLDRKTTATMYPAVSENDILETPIIVNHKLQEEIEKNVKLSQDYLKQSELLYNQAEKMLLEELGLKNLSLKHQLFYASTLKESLKNNRIDAEFYQPKHEQLINHIKNKASIKSLGELVSMKKGIETGSEEYLSSGIPFIRVSNLSKFGIEFNNQQYIFEGLYDELKKHYQPKEGEILLTKDASIGIALVFKENLKCIISGGILRLKIESDIKDEYLCLVINSPLVQLQIERDTGGSIINHWRPEQIKNAIIPILPIAKQEKILKLVLESQQTRNKAKELLEKAKQRVEDLIAGKAK